MEMKKDKQQALKELLYKMADDALIIRHRNSEWTGLGPTIEEDIAFSSMAQDKIGHAYQLYVILHEHLGEAEPDVLGFQRATKDFKCCQLVELPIGEYDFSLIRHLLFDYAEALRYEALKNSSFEPLAQLSAKIRGEIKYHIFHADVWVKQLARATEEAKARLQTALNEAFPYALGIFEEGEYEAKLQVKNIFIGEKTLQEQWLQSLESFLQKAGLEMPDVPSTTPIYGGRKGFHSEFLHPLLQEMTEVHKVDETAEW